MDSIPIYCINMDVATERWAAMQRRLALYGLTCQRWEAVLPDHVKQYEKTFAFHMGLPQKACALSHFTLWRHCQKQNYDRVLILEDDAVFRKDWISIVHAKLKDPSWHALFLNASESITPLETWQLARRQFLTGAYIITRTGMQWLVNVFDRQMSSADEMTVALQANLPCLTYFPWLVIQQGSESYIQSQSHLHSDVAKVRRLLAEADYPLSMYDF